VTSGLPVIRLETATFRLADFKDASRKPLHRPVLLRSHCLYSPCEIVLASNTIT